MEKSNFWFEVETSNVHPVQNCMFGFYYKNSNGRNTHKAEPTPCVVMDFGTDHDRAMAQLKYSEALGEEYALKVVHVVEDNPNGIKVVYERFSETLAGYFEKLDVRRCDIKDDLDEWFKETRVDVHPKMRQLWMAYISMFEKKLKLAPELNEKGCPSSRDPNQAIVSNPLIAMVGGLPKLFNFSPGKCSKPDMFYAFRIYHDYCHRENLSDSIGDHHIRTIHHPRDMVIDGLKHWLSMPAQTKTRSKCIEYKVKGPAAFLHYRAKMDLADFMHDIVLRVSALRNTLTNTVDWSVVQARINNSKHKAVYEKLMKHNAPDGSDSSYTSGFDFPRFIRNGIYHLKQHYLDVMKNVISIQEVVEIMDFDLNFSNILLDLLGKLQNTSIRDQVGSANYVTLLVESNQCLMKLIDYESWIRKDRLS